MNRLQPLGLALPVLIAPMFLSSLLAGDMTPENESLSIDGSARQERTTQRPTQRTRSSSATVSQEIRRINGRLAALMRESDSLRARIVAVETNFQEVTGVMPELKATLESAVKAKTAMDSSELAMVNQFSLLMNKISLLEDKASFIDSTNFEILSQLVLIENKIVSLTQSFSDIMAARQPANLSGGARLSDGEFRQRYIDALKTYQRGDFREAGDSFIDLIKNGGSHDLADNSQYWLAECFYATNNYKRAIMEFGRVFDYAGTDKGDDAQLKIARSYWNAGNHDRARAEFQKLLAEYPQTDLSDSAPQYLK